MGRGVCVAFPSGQKLISGCKFGASIGAESTETCSPRPEVEMALNSEEGKVLMALV